MKLACKPAAFVEPVAFSISAVLVAGVVANVKAAACLAPKVAAFQYAIGSPNPNAANESAWLALTLSLCC